MAVKATLIVKTLMSAAKSIAKTTTKWLLKSRLRLNWLLSESVLPKLRRILSLTKKPSAWLANLEFVKKFNASTWLRAKKPAGCWHSPKVTFYVVISETIRFSLNILHQNSINNLLNLMSFLRE